MLEAHRISIGIELTSKIKMDFIDSWVLGRGVNWAVHFRIEQSKLYNNKKLYSFIQKGAVFLGTKVV